MGGSDVDRSDFCDDQPPRPATFAERAFLVLLISHGVVLLASQSLALFR